MYAVPAVRRTPLWLIFAGLFVLMLTPQPAFRGTVHYTTSRGCQIEERTIGDPAIYTIWQSSCSGRTTAWHWGAIGRVGGIALTIATLITNAVSGWRRGAGWKQQLLDALTIALSLGGLTAFCDGIGSSIDCHSPEGLCAMGVLVGGGLGLALATLGLLVAAIAWAQISRLTRIIAVSAIPGTLALAIIAGIIGSLLNG